MTCCFVKLDRPRALLSHYDMEVQCHIIASQKVCGGEFCITKCPTNKTFIFSSVGVLSFLNPPM